VEQAHGGFVPGHGVTTIVSASADLLGFYLCKSVLSVSSVARFSILAILPVMAILAIYGLPGARGQVLHAPSFALTQRPDPGKNSGECKANRIQNTVQSVVICLEAAAEWDQNVRWNGMRTDRK
jgi:hypothetical protein